MAASTVIKHLFDGTITIEDGTTPTAVSLTVPFTQGDFGASGLGSTLREIAKYETRGTFHSARYTARRYPSGSFTAMLADLSDGTDGTLVDFALNQASYSANVSTLGASAEVYAVKLTLTIEGTDHGDSADHTIELDDCTLVVDVAEGEPNLITVNYECLGGVTMI